MNAYAKNGNVGKMSEKESPLLPPPLGEESVKSAESWEGWEDWEGWECWEDWEL